MRYIIIITWYEGVMLKISHIVFFLDFFEIHVSCYSKIYGFLCFISFRDHFLSFDLLKFWKRKFFNDIGLRVFMMKIFFRDWYGNGCEILKDWLFEKDLKFDFSPLMVQKPFFKNCVQFIIIITCNQEVSSHLVKDQLTETINVDHQAKKVSLNFKLLPFCINTSKIYCQIRLDG